MKLLVQPSNTQRGLQANGRRLLHGELPKGGRPRCVRMDKSSLQPCQYGVRVGYPMPGGPGSPDNTPHGPAVFMQLSLWGQHAALGHGPPSPGSWSLRRRTMNPSCPFKNNVRTQYILLIL